MITPAEYAVKLNAQVELLRKSNRPLALAAQSTHAKMSKRIFVDGQSKSGDIGQYSKKDIWLNPLKMAKRNNNGFDPLKGKDGDTEFKTKLLRFRDQKFRPFQSRFRARKRVTSYFEGWKGFRETQGLKTDKVNLNYTGDMFSDFNRPVQIVNVNEYVATFSRELNAKKAEGNEEHFNRTIFRLTTDERINFFRTANRELKKLLQS